MWRAGGGGGAAVRRGVARCGAMAASERAHRERRHSIDLTGPPTCPGRTPLWQAVSLRCVRHKAHYRIRRCRAVTRKWRDTDRKGGGGGGGAIGSDTPWRWDGPPWEGSRVQADAVTPNCHFELEKMEKRPKRTELFNNARHDCNEFWHCFVFMNFDYFDALKLFIFRNHRRFFTTQSIYLHHSCDIAPPIYVGISGTWLQYIFTFLITLHFCICICDFNEFWVSSNISVDLTT